MRLGFFRENGLSNGRLTEIILCDCEISGSKPLRVMGQGLSGKEFDKPLKKRKNCLNVREYTPLGF
jgi:hypothetical protein